MLLFNIGLKWIKFFRVKILDFRSHIYYRSHILALLNYLDYVVFNFSCLSSHVQMSLNQNLNSTIGMMFKAT